MVRNVDAAVGFAPGGAIDVVRDQLLRLSAQGNTTLGTSFLLSLVASLWSANSGIKALFDSLNAVYEEKEKRAVSSGSMQSLCPLQSAPSPSY